MEFRPYEHLLTIHLFAAEAVRKDEACGEIHESARGRTYICDCNGRRIEALIRTMGGMEVQAKKMASDLAGPFYVALSFGSMEELFDGQALLG